MFRRPYWRVFDIVHSGKSLLLLLGGHEMRNAVEGHARHDVNEQADLLVLPVFELPHVPRDLVHGMKYERIPPHCNRNGIVAKGQAKGADEQTLAAWESPNAQREQKIDKVAEVGQEIMVADLTVCKEADRHKVQQLCCVPVVKILRCSPDEVARYQNVEDAANEAELLADSDRLGGIPSLVDAINTPTHLLAVSVELLIGSWDHTSPFLDDLVSCIEAGRLQSLALLSNALLNAVKVLRESQSFEDVEH